MEIMKRRKTNLDLLRILAMMMIVTLHTLGAGRVLDTVQFGTATYYTAWILETVCFIAVDIYILISGYFLIDSKFKVKKIINLFLEVFFYSIVIYFILLFTGLIHFSIKDLIKVFIPITSNQYWFITRYLVMYIFSPFINILVNNLDKKMHKWLCILLIIFASFISIAFTVLSTLKASLTGTSAIWFMSLYIIAVYIKRYGINVSTKKIIICFFVSLLLMVSIRFSFEYLGGKYSNYSDLLCEIAKVLYSYSSITIVLMSVCTFLLFLRLDIRSERLNKIILFFSPLTFGVYLIHDNKFMRNVLWGYIKPTRFMYSPFFIPCIIVVVILVFTACSIIEFVRRKIFRFIKMDMIEEKIGNKLGNFQKLI